MASQIVANSSAMRAINTASFESDSMKSVFVTTHGDYFRAVQGTSMTPQTGVVYNSNDGRYQWVRMGTSNPTFLAAVYWAIDPVNGNDENTGWGATQAAADASPLKTMAELDRRLAGNPGYTATVKFHLLGDVPAADSRVLQNVVTKGSTAFPIIYGALSSPLTTGTMASYTTAVPGSNTGYTMALTSAATYIGKLVVDQDGTWAYVLSAASANVANITPPCIEQFGSATDAIPGEPGDFTNGKTFSVYSPPALPSYPFRADVMFPAVVRTTLGAAIASSFEGPNLGGSGPYLIQNIVLGNTGSGNGSSGSWTGGFAYWSGCLFYMASAGASNGSGFIHHAGNFQLCSLLNSKLFFRNGSGPRFQERLHIYNGGLSLDETSSVGGVLATTPRLQVGIFATTTTVFNGGRVRLPSDGGVVYGQTNTGTLFNIPQGAAWSLPKAGCTATTSGTVLSVGGTAKAFSDIPFVNTTNNACITDGV